MFFAKTLPDWTIVEFFNQLEELFDAMFIVNERDKLISFYYNYKQLDNKSAQAIIVEDNFQATIDNDNSITKSVANVKI